MSDPALVPSQEAPQPAFRARHALLKRLADVVSLPGSRVNAFERAVTGDLLVEMLRLAAPRERQRVAARLAPLAELPNSLARMLLRDDPAIAGLLLEQCASLTDADLVACARDTGPEHRFLMASRRGLTEVVTETLMTFDEQAVIECLLRNTTARLSQSGVEHIVGLSRQMPVLCGHLLRRPELRPSGAYVMFWWAAGRGPQDHPAALRRLPRGHAGGRRGRLRHGGRRRLAGPGVAQGPAVHRASPAQPRGHRQEPVRQSGACGHSRGP